MNMNKGVMNDLNDFYDINEVKEMRNCFVFME